MIKLSRNDKRNTELQVTDYFIFNGIIYYSGIEIEKPISQIFYTKNGTTITVSDRLYDAQSKQIFVSDNDVYITGKIIDNGKSLQKYWKNGIEYSLESSNYDTETYNLFVYNNKCYIAGIERNLISGERTNYYAKYWVNEVANSLTNGQYPAKLFSMKIINNISYALGVESDGNEHKTDYGSIKCENIKYWIGNIKKSLTTNFLYTLHADIDIVNNDIYIAAYGADQNYKPILKYWKNGVEISDKWMPDNIAFSKIKVTKDNLIIAGFEDDKAKYYLNRNEVLLEATSIDSVITNIYVNNNDVYITGSIDNKAVYWKNGALQKLPTSQYNTVATSIFITESN